MRSSSIPRRQPQTPNAEPKNLGSNTAEQNISRKRTAHLAALEKTSAYQESLNQAPQREVKRRNFGSFNPQKRTVQTVQSEIASDYGLGVGIGTIDNLEEVISSLLYPGPSPQVFSPPIDFGSQPEVSNAPNEEDICLDFSEYLINYDEGDQPESLDTEMTMGIQEKGLSEIPLEKLSITELLDTSLGFDCSEDIPKDFSLDFLDSLNLADENAVPGNQNTEMNLGGESEANHARLFSGVWELPPGLKRMRINYDALQSFIKTASPDLTMSAPKLRESFKNAYKKEACPVLGVFDKDLKKLRDKWAKANPGQPKLWEEHIKVDHEALRNFIKETSPDLTMSAPELQEAFKNTYEKEACPTLSVFEKDLKKLRTECGGKPVRARPRSWKPIKVEHKALQNFIKGMSPDLTLSALKLQQAFETDYGKEACPGLTVFKKTLKELRDKQVEEN